MLIPHWPIYTGPNKDFDHVIQRVLYVLQRLGNPHLKLKNVIHITGTKGKGSTALYISNILQSAGYSVNTYISPHIYECNERILFNGEKITDEELYEVTETVRCVCEEGGNKSEPLELAMFEALTCSAFWIFAKRNADFNVIEVGMGGLKDATNVFDMNPPLACVFVPIHLDHTKFLGKKVEDVAWSKSFLIKKNTQNIILSSQSKEAKCVLKNVCKTLNISNEHIFCYGEDYEAFRSENDIQGDEIMQNNGINGIIDDVDCISKTINNVNYNVNNINTLNNDIRNMVDNDNSTLNIGSSTNIRSSATIDDDMCNTNSNDVNTLNVNTLNDNTNNIIIDNVIVKTGNNYYMPNNNIYNIVGDNTLNNKNSTTIIKAGNPIFESETLDVCFPFKEPNMVGDYQLINASCAIMTCLACQKSGKADKLSLDAINNGIAKTINIVRMQQITSGKLFNMLPSESVFYVDGAHNKLAAHALATFINEFKEYAQKNEEKKTEIKRKYNEKFCQESKKNKNKENEKNKKYKICVAIARTKGADNDAFLEEFLDFMYKPIVDLIICTRANLESIPEPPEKIAESCKKFNFTYSIAYTITDVIQRVSQFAKNCPILLICTGSLYIARDIYVYNNDYKYFK